VQKLLFVGSSCIYPKFAKQPMSEDRLLTGELEPTNEWYAIAKIAGINLCQAYRHQHDADFVSVMPTNLYGPRDNYHPEHSHVAAALIRRLHEAKRANASSVVVWKSGTPRQEFLYVDDFADACVFVLKNYSDFDFINIGYGRDISIAELPNRLLTWWGTLARLSTTCQSPTAHQSNSSMCRALRRWVGTRKPRYRMALRRRTRIFEKET
jgi:GDP-L-fucose synthase